jgi:rubrerythrin
VYERELASRQTTETEFNYLDSFVAEWRQLLAQQFRQLRQSQEEDINRRRTTAASQSEPADLGSQFADMRLNMRVKRVGGKPDPAAKDEAGEKEEMSVLSSATVDGCLQFTCRVCSITVLGKKNIDSHLDGKKHAAKMVDWEVIGKGFLFLCSSFYSEFIRISVFRFQIH